MLCYTVFDLGDYIGIELVGLELWDYIGIELGNDYAGKLCLIYLVKVHTITEPKKVHAKE